MEADILTSTQEHAVCIMSWNVVSTGNANCCVQTRHWWKLPQINFLDCIHPLLALGAPGQKSGVKSKWLKMVVNGPPPPFVARQLFFLKEVCESVLNVVTSKDSIAMKVAHVASPGGYPCHYGLGEQCTNTWDRQPMAQPHTLCYLSVVCFMLVSPISLVHVCFFPIRSRCLLLVCCHFVVVVLVVSAAGGGGGSHRTLLMSRHGSKVLDWWPQIPQVSRERSCPCNGEETVLQVKSCIFDNCQIPKPMIMQSPPNECSWNKSTRTDLCRMRCFIHVLVTQGSWLLHSTLWLATGLTLKQAQRALSRTQGCNIFLTLLALQLAMSEGVIHWIAGVSSGIQDF